ncbi:hypothetical protein D3C86_2234060 [compost metagenome]
MVLTHRDSQCFAAPELAGEPCWHVVKTAQHHVQFTSIQRLGGQAGSQMGNIDAQVRRLRLQARQ